MPRFGLCVALLCSAAACPADDLDREPIRYKDAAADNAVARLQKKLDAGTLTLKPTDAHGYLPAVLKELDIPASSQVLVFSKTSLQRDRITPATPRAIYFNDDVYVGFCRNGEVLEVSAADLSLGTAFYTLDQPPTAAPKFVRQTDTCLTCHATNAATGGAPGHLLRSVFADREGQPVLSAGSHRTTQASPWAERWGGWYVTGTHGKDEHRGNWVVKDRKNPEAEGNAGGQNVTDLKGRFDAGDYLTPHSDLVALLVLAHQAEGHTLLARAMIDSRQARHYELQLNKDLGEPATKRWDSAARRVAAAGERLARHFLFCGEAELSGPVAGTSKFAEEFAARGPKDGKGRSLREFDLKRRVFKYPCSYLVYSDAFAALPADVKGHTLKRMLEVLSGKDQSPAFAHLSATDRAAVLDILRDTLPGLPDVWKK